MAPGGTDSMIVVPAVASSNALPRGAVDVLTGNFGGLGNTDLAFHDAAARTLTSFTVVDTSGVGSSGEIVYSANLALRETLSIAAGAADLVAAGSFWRANPEDHWFDDGPPMSSTPPYDPEWRFGAGGFSDFLTYDRGAGIGRTYFHEPITPVVQPISGYISSLTSHGSAAPVSTGSVLPGETIGFHISSHQGAYSITIYRQGVSIEGRTEEMMATIEGLPSNPAPHAIARNAYADGALWPAAKTFVVPQWPSGLYLARVQTLGTPTSGIDIPFVVRASAGSTNRILFVLADATYAAYNDWGGRNLYGNVSGFRFYWQLPQRLVRPRPLRLPAVIREAAP